MFELSTIGCLQNDTEKRLIGRACFVAILESQKFDKCFIALISAPDDDSGKYLASAKTFDCKDQIASYNKMKRFLSQFFVERTVVDRFGTAGRLPFLPRKFETGMGFLSLSAATKELYQLVESNKIEISTTGSNMVIDEDKVGNYKPDSRASDGEMVALVMAISGMMAKALDAEQPIDPIPVLISKIDLKPDDILVVRFQRPVGDAALQRVIERVREHTGLNKVLFFDEPVDLSIISTLTNNE